MTVLDPEKKVLRGAPNSESCSAPTRVNGRRRVRSPILYWDAGGLDRAVGRRLE